MINRHAVTAVVIIWPIFKVFRITNTFSKLQPPQIQNRNPLSQHIKTPAFILIIKITKIIATLMSPNKQLHSGKSFNKAQSIYLILSLYSLIFYLLFHRTNSRTTKNTKSIKQKMQTNQLVPNSKSLKSK